MAAFLNFGSPNWARTSDLRINSPEFFFTENPRNTFIHAGFQPIRGFGVAQILSKNTPSFMPFCKISVQIRSRFSLVNSRAHQNLFA